MLALGVEVQREGANPFAIGFGDSRVQRDHRGGGDFLFLAVQRVPLGTACGERFADLGEARGAVGDRCDQALHREVDLGDPPVDRSGVLLAVGLLRLDLEVIALHQTRYRFGGEQLLADPGQDAPLELDATHRAVDIASAGLAMPDAADPAVADDDHRPCAAAAAHQAAQQIFRPAAADQRALRQLLRLFLRVLPSVVADDAQLRHLHRHPLVLRVAAGHPLPAFGVALHVDAIVEIAAGVDRVAQHADAALTITGQSRGAPFAASRRGDAVAVEAVADHLRAAAVEIFLVDPLHDRGLFRVHPAQAALEFALRADLRDDVVSVGQAARHAPAADRATLPAPDLVGEVLQE